MRKEMQADIPYFNQERRGRAAAPSAPRQQEAGGLAWRKGETAAQYAARAQAAGHQITSRSIHIEKERVSAQTRRILVRNAEATFDRLHKSMPPPVQSLMEPSREGNTLSHMPHLGFIDVLKLTAVYPDGRRSRLRFVASNFEANAVLGHDGLQFMARKQATPAALNNGSFFIFGRWINEDGTPGRFDPVFLRNGAAYRPGTMKEVASTLLRIGKMTTVAERRLWVESDATAEASCPGSVADTPPEEPPKAYDPNSMVIPLEYVSALPRR